MQRRAWIWSWARPRCLLHLRLVVWTWTRSTGLSLRLLGRLAPWAFRLLRRWRRVGATEPRSSTCWAWSSTTAPSRLVRPPPRRRPRPGHSDSRGPLHPVVRGGPLRHWLGGRHQGAFARGRLQPQGGHGRGGGHAGSGHGGGRRAGSFFDLGVFGTFSGDWGGPAHDGPWPLSARGSAVLGGARASDGQGVAQARRRTAWP